MSRLLLLMPSVPWRLDAGAKLRNAGLLAVLGKEHSVDVVVFGNADHHRPNVTFVPVPAHRSGLARVADMARSDLPDMAHRLASPRFAEAVRCKLQSASYDVVQAEGIEMARYLRLVPPERRVYDAHNAEFLLQSRLAGGGSLAGRVYSRLQAARLQRFERDIVRSSALTLAVSNHDANQLLALAGGSGNVHVVPNGVFVTRYAWRPPESNASPNLLFLGKLDFRPNADALAWVIRDVLGRLPEARLFAVGGAPPRWLVAAGQHDSRIAVTGYVENEKPYFARCAALVLPVRTGGGSRLKALVAMASGLPIVSTRLGMEGLDAEPGTHYLAAETAEEWVQAICHVLEDAQLRLRIAFSARRLVEQRYDWAAIRPEVTAAYASIGV